MSKFTFQLAQEKNDPELREILRINHIEGDMCVSFQREPNYFYASKICNHFQQTPVVINKDNQRIVGFGSRIIYEAFINGQKRPLGYLSNLRLNRECRNSTIIPRAYRYLNELHEDKRVSLYVTTVIEDNHYAKRLLSSQRAGLPTYRDYGVYNSFSIFPLKKQKLSGHYVMERGSHARLDEILDCIYKNGSQKQFYPYLSKDFFLSKNGVLRDFCIHDFYIAIKQDRVVGVLAKWDQSHFKQTIIEGYNGKLKWIRPFYNRCAKILEYPQLPDTKVPLNFFYISFVAIDNNNVDIFKDLLATVNNDAIDSQYSFFVVGLHSEDDLKDCIKGYRNIVYKSRLYIVYWEDGKDAFSSLERRMPYLEVGIL